MGASERKWVATMDVKACPVSEDWVPVGVDLKKPANRKANDRGKRSVAELIAAGQQQAIQRDGYYRPRDGMAEFLTFWTATSRGWAPVCAFGWNGENKAWEPAEHTGPKPN